MRFYWINESVVLLSGAVHLSPSWSTPSSAVPTASLQWPLSQRSKSQPGSMTPLMMGVSLTFYLPTCRLHPLPLRKEPPGWTSTCRRSSDGSGRRLGLRLAQPREGCWVWPRLPRWCVACLLELTGRITLSLSKMCRYSKICLKMNHLSIVKIKCEYGMHVWDGVD